MENIITIKPISEICENESKLISFVHNGRITLNSKGYVEFFMDYKLKNDTEMRHTGYGFSFENDNYLSKGEIPRQKIFVKGSLVRFCYRMFHNRILIEITNGDYRTSHSVEITDEQRKAYLEDNQKFFVNHPLDFNSIGNKYIYVTNGVATYKN